MEQKINAETSIDRPYLSYLSDQDPIPVPSPFFFSHVMAMVSEHPAATFTWMSWRRELYRWMVFVMENL